MADFEYHRVGPDPRPGLRPSFEEGRLGEGCSPAHACYMQGHQLDLDLLIQCGSIQQPSLRGGRDCVHAGLPAAVGACHWCTYCILFFATKCGTWPRQLIAGAAFISFFERHEAQSRQFIFHGLARNGCTAGGMRWCAMGALGQGEPFSPSQPSQQSAAGQLRGMVASLNKTLTADRPLEGDTVTAWIMGACRHCKGRWIAPRK
jgi:hypothetical protein